ncbi:hypothetical protein DPMN_134808 [Dreissena polymorpha]|uniref:Uncharacterized protein n=1 Tax=Dreissena polymorpha TaxID=45954 RepID=A0A9D4G0L4_DREPO|nr:hypothetical protein DPMN_134808 [Dreissena polymorpha]
MRLPALIMLLTLNLLQGQMSTSIPHAQRMGRAATTHTGTSRFLILYTRKINFIHT